MHKDRSDVATGEKLCCCNIEPVWRINPQKQSVVFIYSSAAEGKERELTPELRVQHFGPGEVNKVSPVISDYGQTQTEQERLTLQILTMQLS